MIAGFFYCITRFCPVLAWVSLAVATSLHGSESASAAQREITNEHPYLHLIQVPNNGFTLSATLTEVPAGGDVTLAGESSSDGGERWRLAVEGDGADRRLIFELRICGDPDIVKAVEENFNEKQFFTTAR